MSGVQPARGMTDMMNSVIRRLRRTLNPQTSSRHGDNIGIVFENVLQQGSEWLCTAPRETAEPSTEFANFSSPNLQPARGWLSCHQEVHAEKTWDFSEI
mmetsp:Transcript_8703/g.15419  ORF Transcript_8703/g.15419 Transcript_8703/m.15419 type:complete len:99 (-) Transcript_8703:475-771(-)